MAVQTVQTVKFRCPHCATQVDVDPQGESDLVVCPNCHKPFQVRVPVAQALDGPSAGVHHQAAPAVPQPAQGAAPAAIPVQTPAAAPQAAPQPSAQPQQERVLQTIQLAMFRRYPGRVLAYVAAIVGLTAAAIYLFNINWVPVAWVAVAGTVFALVRFGLWWWRMQNTTLTLTNRRCILETGLLTTEKTEFDLDDLSDVLVHQGVMMRMLGIGDLTLVSQGADSVRQVVIMAVPEAEAVATQLRELRVTGEEKPHAE